MDGQRFDCISRRIGNSSSRRGVLRGLLAATAAAGIATATLSHDASAHKDRRARLLAKMCPPCGNCEACWDGRCVWICG